ncbi:MAG: ABC transporter permease [Dysgonamonadaceae bacterium]|jgi:putative ABC transport system permease protein|nr:ABC transporter permease [Dysgonamonadaceae bacterium]
MIDTLQEIFDTLKKNKLRTTLTGLSVSWGIFILIVLLGAGNGLKNGVMENFGDRAINRIGLWAGTTSIPYKGLKSRRYLRFMEKQLTAIADEVPESRKISPRSSVTQIISYGQEYNSYNITGVTPDFVDLELPVIKPGNGRFINQLDEKEANKVIVLDQKIVDALFKGKSAVGEYVKVGELMFKVVGVNSKKSRWGTPNGYIPFTTSQLIFNPGKKFNRIVFSVNGLDTKAANEKFDEDLRKVMARSLSFDPNDMEALWINNSQQEYLQTMQIFGGINVFVTIIGLLTLIAGIVGVSNIMLVSVKERTREIGIRKAIGATPGAILKNIIVEAIIITAIFGYIGMLAGIGLTEGINMVMEQSAAATANSDEVQMSVFKNPTVNIGIVFFSTMILVVAGVIAGYMPARKAVKVKPIEAMRDE